MLCEKVVMGRLQELLSELKKKVVYIEMKSISNSQHVTAHVKSGQEIGFR